jgi:diguanylate cyclase (GGDEF)-like protein/PAS domain S-box-containing protein
VLARRQGRTAGATETPASEELRQNTQDLVDIISDLYDRQARAAVQLNRELAEHQRAESALSRQREYREFILQLAMSFINLPVERMDNAVEEALARMSAFFHADRAYVFRYDFDTQTADNTHEWCAPGVEPMIAELQGLPLTLYPQWLEAHLRREPFVIPDVAKLTDEPIKGLLQSQNIRSLLTTPLMDGEVCLGFAGFDSVREWRDYGRDERETLELFANLLTSISQRVQVATTLRDKTKALALAHDRLVNILDGTNAGVYVADMQTHEVLFVNALSRKLLGDVVGKTCWKTIQGKSDGPCSFCTNPRLVGADGTPAPPVVWEHYNPVLDRWFQLHDQAIPWDDGRLVRLEIALDVTDQKQLEQSLRDSEERYRQLFEQSRDALMIVAPPQWRLIAGNPAMVELFGAQDLDELLTLKPGDLSPPTQPDGTPSDKRAVELLDITLRKGSWLGEWVHRRRDGRDITCTVLLNRTEIKGQTVIQGTVRDITLQKAQQRQLERIAHYDPLTGLPNRSLLADRMLQAMAQANRRGTTLAIAYLDLDGFKAVNDRHGHDAGDRLLMAGANRMRQALRETDTLARLGGDEFVAVLADLPAPEACLPTLTRLLDAASKEMLDKGFSLRVSASLGVTFYPQAEPIDADQLLRQADQAMYQAKLSGKNRYHLFDIERDQAARGHHENLARITRALRDREFVLHYQPKVNMRSGKVIGLEALVRWNHPEHGILPPGDFLPLIEGHPLEVELGAWVIDAALSQIHAWREGGLHLPLSVNIGALQIQSPDFVRQLSELLKQHPKVPAQDLELEILESSALQDLELVTQIIADCRSLGVGFAIDDFGTGYSSLTYLKRLPAGTLKIDRSFVRDMLVDADDLAILKGVLGLAQAFRRLAIAEGVESIEQGEALLDLGCELAQGYCIARPMPAEQVPLWATNWRTPASWLNRPAPR